MLDLVADLLFGWVFDLLPFDISRAHRERRYKRGERVSIRGSVGGVPGVPRFADFVLLQRGQLWVSRSRKSEGELYPVPRPIGSIEIVRRRPSWSKNPALRYEAGDTTVEITASDAASFDLLLQALNDPSE